MINFETSQLSNSLAYEDMLPLSWEVMDEGSQAINLARVAEQNEHVLHCINLLSDQITEKVDDESETESALLRLEAKVNLILEMLSKLAGDRDDIPQPVQVRVAATGIEWICMEQQPAEGDRIWIQLHIDNRVPEAVCLPAQVEAVAAASSGAVVFARFEDIGSGVQDQLEKLIFRHHRRMVAQSKLK